MYKSSKRVCFLLFLTIISVSCIPIALAAGTVQNPQETVSADIKSIREKQFDDATISDDTVDVAQYLLSEEAIQYYAYLNYEEAEPPLKPVILEARNKIIYRYSWVADGLRGRICDSEGNLKETLPEFSDLFPEDWKEPVHPIQDVDLSYYGIKVK